MKLQPASILWVLILACTAAVGFCVSIVFMLGIVPWWQRINAAGYDSASADMTISLSFSQPGTLAFMALPNTPLSAGAVLAQLENGDAVAAKEVAETNLAVEEGKMAELEAVAGEEAAFAAGQRQGALATASSTLLQAEQGMVAAALSAASSTSIALAKTDPLFSTSTVAGQGIALPVDPLTAATLLSGWQSARGSAADAVTNAQSISLGSLTLATPPTVINESNDIAEVQLFLEDLGLAAKNTTTTNISSVNQALDALLDAEASLTQARNSFLTLSGSTTTTLSAVATKDIFGRNLAVEENQEKIAIANAEAALATASTTVAQTYLYAPSAGEVAARNISVGQNVVAGQTVLSFRSFAH